MVYERVEPEHPCMAQDGHAWVEVFTMRSDIPERAYCPLCGHAWAIAVFEAGAS